MATRPPARRHAAAAETFSGVAGAICVFRLDAMWAPVGRCVRTRLYINWFCPAASIECARSARAAARRTMEPLAKSIERGEFSCSRGRSGRRSGRRGPELGDAEYLIDRECHHAEHEVAFDLDRAAHAHGPCAEFILQSGVDAFGQGAKI